MSTFQDYDVMYYGERLLELIQRTNEGIEQINKKGSPDLMASLLPRVVFDFPAEAPEIKESGELRGIWVVFDRGNFNFYPNPDVAKKEIVDIVSKNDVGEICLLSAASHEGKDYLRVGVCTRSMDVWASVEISRTAEELILGEWCPGKADRHPRQEFLTHWFVKAGKGDDEPQFQNHYYHDESCKPGSPEYELLESTHSDPSQLPVFGPEGLFNNTAHFRQRGYDLSLLTQQIQNLQTGDQVTLCFLVNGKVGKHLSPEMRPLALQMGFEIMKVRVTAINGKWPDVNYQGVLLNMPYFFAPDELTLGSQVCFTCDHIHPSSFPKLLQMRGISDDGEPLIVEKIKRLVQQFGGGQK
jgi:hypothetical protein